MKSVVEDINSVQKRLKITVPPESVSKAFVRAYDRLRTKAKVHGFRPGKTPLSIVRKLYEGSVGHEVVDSLIQASLFEAIEQSGVRPVARPFVEQLAPAVEDKEYSYSAVVDVMPNFEVKGMYSGLTIEHSPLVYEQEYGQKGLDDELRALSRSHAKMHPCQEEDVAGQGFVGKLTIRAYDWDHKVLDWASSQNRSFDFGEGQIFPKELDEACAGMRGGESRTVNIKAEGLGLKAGSDQLVRFEVLLHELMKIEYPTLDDEFAKDLGFDTLLQVQEQFEKRARERIELANMDALHKAVLAAIKERVPFEMPPALIEKSIDERIMQFLSKQSEQEQRLALDNAQIRESLRDGIRDQMKDAYLLHQISREENIEVTEEEMKDEASEAEQRNFEGSKNQIAFRLSMTKTLNRLVELSKVVKFASPAASGLA
ncbi:MAG: trigger factor [Oligoflexales bacterium]|nr:trigger factor [Oligoflexales bacterium]